MLTGINLLQVSLGSRGSQGSSLSLVLALLSSLAPPRSCRLIGTRSEELCPRLLREGGEVGLKPSPCLSPGVALQHWELAAPGSEWALGLQPWLDPEQPAPGDRRGLDSRPPHNVPDQPALCPKGQAPASPAPPRPARGSPTRAPYPADCARGRPGPHSVAGSDSAGARWPRPVTAGLHYLFLYFFESGIAGAAQWGEGRDQGQGVSGQREPVPAHRA